MERVASAVMKIRIPARAAAVATALVLALTGCSSDNTASSENPGEPEPARSDRATPSAGPADVSSSPAPSTDARFAVFADGVPAEGWELTESYQVPEGGAKDDRPIEPSLTFSAEYRGPGANPNVAPFIAVSGHEADLAERRELQGELDREVTEGEIGGRKAFWASDPEDVEGGVTVAIAFAEDFTVELTGASVTLDQLRGFAAALKPATEQEWAAAGGTLAD